MPKGVDAITLGAQACCEVRTPPNVADSINNWRQTFPEAQDSIFHDRDQEITKQRQQQSHVSLRGMYAYQSPNPPRQS